MFNKILVANRGEIACRVMRTAGALGYRTVAVFSDADASAQHVAQADEAVRIGPAPAAQSYLSIPALLAAARASGADALHPGYGFLSERADFAQACVDAGLVFIGPPAAAIAAMGDKAGAKRRLLAAGVPCAPGYQGDDQDDGRLIVEAHTLGFPLLVKAVAGGGGRGMRQVQGADELPAALAAARREAMSAFGDDRLLLERLIEGARHVEIQVFADAHGNALHLGERDCSAQRRRQKLIEESPSPIVDAALREHMGRDAVAAALAVGYVGAGTVEFVVDGARNHYFLEMNTRLQVEHPVTEFVTGLDLVEWQLRVAAGEPLVRIVPGLQGAIRFSGHAIEARLYAEEPSDGFKPQTGRILHWQPDAALRRANPAGSPHSLRVDTGVAQGDEVSSFYDALLAKFIVHGRDRADALRRLTAALDDAPLLGPQTNARFLRDLLRHPAFTEARLATTTIDDWAAAGAVGGAGEPLLQPMQPDAAAWRIGAALLALRGVTPPADSPMRAASVAAWSLVLRHADQTRVLRVQPDGDAVLVTQDGSTHQLRLLQRDGHQVRIEHDGIQRTLVCVEAGRGVHFVLDGVCLRFDEVPAAPAAAPASDPRRACAPVAGQVAQLLVRAGERVAAGQPLASIEAMKIEMWLHAGCAGCVAAVHVAAGDAVAAGTLLVEITNEGGPT